MQKHLKLWQEFKEFAVKGNVMDLAVAVIIGGAFGKIITSLVGDIIMPPIGLVLSRVDFKDLYVSLNGQYYPNLATAKAAGAPVIAYGNFLNNVINFLLVAAAIFMLVRTINRFQRPVVAPAPETTECPYCLSKIPQKATRCPSCTSELRAA